MNLFYQGSVYATISRDSGSVSHPNYRRFYRKQCPVSAQRIGPGLGPPPSIIRAVEVDVVIVICKEINGDDSQFLVVRRYDSFVNNGQGGQVTEEVECAGAVAMYLNMGWRLRDVFSFLVDDKLTSEYIFVPERGDENGGR